MKATRTVGLAVAAFAVLSWAVPARGQSAWQVAGYNLQGDVSAGGRVVIDGPSQTRRQKFEEYRDISDGAFLDGLHLRLFRPDERYSLELDGEKWGQQDQSFGLNASSLGKWSFGFEWDQTPHILSTTARTLEHEASRGVFVLPTPRPNLNAWNAAPFLDSVGLRWDTARVGATFTPTPDLEIRAEYTRIRKEGEKPIGMVFGGFGNNFVETLEPIDQTIHDFRIRGTYARENWQVQFGYTLSAFTNDDRSLITDNPCFGLTGSVASGGCGSDATGAPVRGQTSLPPDNIAHTINLAGGVNLPLRTRLTGNFSYGLRLQNEDFIAPTINPALASNAALALPEKSLDGLVQTLLFNLNASSRPIDMLTVTAKYRLYDLDDQSRTITVGAVVVGDRTVDVGDLRANRPSYTKQNADLDGRWRLFNALAVSTGGGWESWDRSKTREVHHSDEFYGKVAVDATPLDWLQARLAYRPAFLRTDTYHTFSPLINSEIETLSPSTFQSFNSFGLRKFDEASRDRQQVDLMLDVSPLDTMTTTLTGGWRYDNYLYSALGVQAQETWSAGIDVSWVPVDRLAFFAGYVRDVNFIKIQSRDRSGVIDTANFNWISDNTDTTDTFRLGGKLILIPRTLDLNAEADYSFTTGQVAMRNPNPVALGPASERANATVRPFPTTDDSLLRIETALRYHFWKVWTASLGYAFESFGKHDFRTDTLMPFMQGIDSIWLGNDAKAYAAHIVGVTLAYQFR